METLLALIALDWTQIGGWLINAGIGGAALALIQGIFSRFKEQDDKEKVTFDTILLAQEALRKELNDRLNKAEQQAYDFTKKIDAQEKEIYKLKLIIREQELKIGHYEKKISDYEAEIVQLKTRLTAGGIQ